MPMRKYENIILPILVALALFIFSTSSANSSVPNTDTSAGRVNANVASRPKYLLSLQFASNANNFPTADPSPDGTPLTETSATGRTQSSGIVTVELTGGFTAPVTLTAYYWVKDSVTAANSHWSRLGPAAASYAVAMDSHYTTATFVCPPNTPFLITSSAAITGNVYIDCIADPLNSNRPAGY